MKPGLKKMILKLETRHADLTRLMKLQNSVAALETLLWFGDDLSTMAWSAYESVSQFYTIPFNRIRSKMRGDEATSLARQIIFHLMRLHGAKQAAIAKLFRRDHATVIHAVRVIATRKETDRKFAAQLCAIEHECNLRLTEMKNGKPQTERKEG